MNMILTQLDCVDGLYVPASGADESLCMGACYVLDSENAKPLTNTYLGKDVSEGISNDNIKTLFLDKNYEVTMNVNHNEIAKILAKGNVVAQVRGREEFGARALGNRSIIASPNDPDVVKMINEAIKNRDFWMPFALSIMADKTDGFINNPKNIDSPSMTIGFEGLSFKLANPSNTSRSSVRTSLPCCSLSKIFLISSGIIFAYINT